jgi:hypothetical protein
VLAQELGKGFPQVEVVFDEQQVHEPSVDFGWTDDALSS